jgi:hypothetical protein
LAKRKHFEKIGKKGQTKQRQSKGEKKNDTCAI